jgi:hypothetical protein
MREGGKVMLSRTKLAVATIATMLAGTALAATPALADHMGRGHGGGPGFGFSFGVGPGPYYGYNGYYEPAVPEYDYTYSEPAYVYNDTEAWCAARFRTYDSVTHTYTGYDGLPHRCP